MPRIYLDYLADERCFFILSPYDIVKGEHRDYDDHIDFLISKNQYEVSVFNKKKPPTDDSLMFSSRKLSKHFNHLQTIINDQDDIPGRYKTN